MITKSEGIKQTNKQQKLHHGKQKITKIKENGTFITVKEQILEKYKKYYKNYIKIILARLFVSNPLEDQTSVPPITRSKINLQ